MPTAEPGGIAPLHPLDVVHGTMVRYISTYVLWTVSILSTKTPVGHQDKVS